MATTTNYGYTKPTVGGDAGTWGTALNSDLVKIDSDLYAVEGVADAALPLAGGTMTGNVDVFSSTAGLTALGSVSGATALDLALGNVFTLTIGGATTLSISNCPSGTFAVPLLLQITNPSTNITWPASFDWAGGVAPTMTTTGVDVIGAISFDSGTTWRAMAISLDSK